jgi:hypothetical protein
MRLFRGCSSLPRWLVLPLCLAALPLVPARLRAQCPVTNPSCTGAPPTVSIGPASGGVATPSVVVTIQWSGSAELNPASRSIRVDNADSVGAFSYTQSADGLTATSQGTVWLAASASVAVSALICDTQQRCSQTATATYGYHPAPQVIALQSQVTRVPSAVGNELSGLERFRVVNPALSSRRRSRCRRCAATPSRAHPRQGR